MNEHVMRIYHAMPAPLRSVGATLRGLQLRSWRYGPETGRLVEEALAREQWDLHGWRRWQEERLAFVLHRAATRVPYYRALWAERRRKGDRASWSYLENWPVLEKEPLRARPHAFVADDCSVERMWCVHTSGTTGKSLSLWRSRATERTIYALAAARRRRWYGVSRRHRHALVGGQLVAPVRQSRPPFWVWNATLRQLYMSSYHLSPSLLRHYLDALAQYRVVYLEGYTSSLHALAQQAEAEGRNDLRMKVAVANAEPVFQYQRASIEAAFGCSLRESYGMAEMVAAASECSHGRLHLWPEVGWTEVLADRDRLAPPGATGDLVCTGILNADMPLIRYRVGDRGAVAPADEQCACGRSLPILLSVEGRADDVLFTRDGRRIGRLDPVFKADLPVREAQIVQETLDRVRVRYVPAPHFTPESGRSIVERLRARMGSVEVVLEEVDAVPRTSAGKFRAVLCEVPAEQRARLCGTPGGAP